MIKDLKWKCILKGSLKAYFDQRNFTISASHSELELEIIQEVNQQFKKKYPKICPQFSRHVFKG